MSHLSLSLITEQTRTRVCYFVKRLESESAILKAAFPKDLFSDDMLGYTSPKLVSDDEAQMSHLMRLWHFSSSVNSVFKHTCAAIQWGYMSDVWSDPSSTSVLHVCEQ